MLSALAAVVMARARAAGGRPVVEPLTCTVAHSLDQVGRALDRTDDRDDASTLPTSARFAGAPAVIPLDHLDDTA